MEDENITNSATNNTNEETVETPEVNNTNAENAEVENQESENTEGKENQNTEIQSNETAENMFSEKEILEKFNNIADSIEGLVELANEGLENRNEVISEALDSGVHYLGNAFDKDVFSKTFSSMKTKDIKKMGKTWEEQANDKFSHTKVSKQDFSNENEDNVVRVDYKQFKTSNY